MSVMGVPNSHRMYMGFPSHSLMSGRALGDKMKERTSSVPG
jgi:hypothetical protein